MKIQKETALFQTPFGSHLYGTNTPTSDFDFKVVCLPKHDDLLLNKKLTNRVEKPEGHTAGSKMGADQVEREFIPLQIYLDHFFDGQTYAIEMAFAVLQGKHTLLVPDTEGFIARWMKQLVEHFSNRNIQKMVGYAVAQSQQYGLKTERYNTLIAMDSMITNFFADENYDTALKEYPALLNALYREAGGTEISIMNGAGGAVAVPGIEISGKQFPLTAKWATVQESIRRSLKTYGNRVKGHTGQPTDWKALSHAIRIIEQLHEFTQSGTISFPRPNAEFLLTVKNGKMPLDEATDYLTQLFNKIDSSVAASILRERNEELEMRFEVFKLDLLKTYYKRIE